MNIHICCDIAASKCWNANYFQIIVCKIYELTYKYFTYFICASLFIKNNKLLNLNIPYPFWHTRYMLSVCDLYVCMCFCMCALTYTNILLRIKFVSEEHEVKLIELSHLHYLSLFNHKKCDYHFKIYYYLHYFTFLM